MWVEKESEESDVKRSDEPSASTNAMGLNVGVNGDVEMVHQLTTEQKHALTSIILGEDEYEEDVPEARTNIRAAIGDLTGAKFDDKAVRRRLSWRTSISEWLGLRAGV